uniref:Uncharacterized protein n=1 Tax=Oryza nivara TaxID=4536 RepID=A0A0E0HKI9_ORYNI
MVSSKQWCPSDEKGKAKISSFRFRWPPPTAAAEAELLVCFCECECECECSLQFGGNRSAVTAGAGARMEKNKYIGGGYLLSEEEALGGGQLIDEAKEMARKKDLELEAECFVSASTSRMLLVEVFSGELVHMDGELAVALNNVLSWAVGLMMCQGAGTSRMLLVTLEVFNGVTGSGTHGCCLLGCGQI